ncbi:MAG: DUF6922 domain-containing protein [Candidatus Dormibacterales bacterium]
MSLPEAVREAFWNLDAAHLLADRDQDLIIATILPRGGKAAVQWLVRTYGPAAIRDFVVRDAEGLRILPEPDRRLWLRALAPGYPEPDGADRWRTARRVPPVERRRPPGGPTGGEPRPPREDRSS